MVPFTRQVVMSKEQFDELGQTIMDEFIFQTAICGYPIKESLRNTIDKVLGQIVEINDSREIFGRDYRSFTLPKPRPKPRKKKKK